MCQASQLIGGVHCESVANLLTVDNAQHTVSTLIQAGLSTVTDLDTVPNAQLLYDSPKVSSDLRIAVQNELDWQQDATLVQKLNAMLDNLPAPGISACTVLTPVVTKAEQPVTVSARF